MSLPQETIERAFQTLLASAQRDPAVWREFERSRLEFLEPTVPPRSARSAEMAARRHAEWFLLERPSDVLASAPAAALEVETLKGDDPDPEVAEGRQALMGSFASVFEITGVSSGEGVWVRDLAGAGEYPLEEADASRALEAGDLLVGRIFPVGDALYRISHASGFFRDGRLLEAVRKDLEQARAGRRGVLRLSQRDLESMFFGALAVQSASRDLDEEPLAAPAPERRDVVEAAREILRAGGLSASDADEVLAELAAQPFDPASILPGAGDRLGEILTQLAFESDVDIEAARIALAKAWPKLSPPQDEPAVLRPAPPQRPAKKHTPAGPARDVQRALAQFDAGRASGADLESLFADLERELELDAEEAPDDPVAPDFPGVVGAMVVEFLWDVERERGADAARSLAAIASFADFARSHGVFENLGERDLLLFACLWLPEHAASAQEASRTLAALVEFAQWAETTHGVLLGTALARTARELAVSLPRVCSANSVLRARLGALDEGGEMLGYVGGATARTPKGEERTVTIEQAAAGFVEPGDFLRAERTPARLLRVVCVYPPQTARLAELG